MMIVNDYPKSPKQTGQSLPPSRKEDSILPWHHHAWAYTTGDAIERHNMLTVKERKKSTKRKKENIIIYYINY